ncbi:Succinate dehydrogenase assembly factor 4, mitochondrial [Vanrija pseudolonga]|uniref:Succinate dehydrogenase assembly factor 4, mitochondrial n=1 Tax=Vanrija pseudolonga TaxID=143232 RepID=A0AAF0Y5F9_9TREE|nr:Succinate dehydrogenase assembly factor 4, mitochondrial [Vanrija pseudolonga]
MLSLRLPRLTRALSTAAPLRTSFKSGPRPPALPAAEQAEFDRLVKAAEAGQSGTVSTSVEELEAATTHPDARKGPKPEFEGDTNPKTGEIGGPKQDPFIAGNADWQFGGRVTDF